MGGGERAVTGSSVGFHLFQEQFGFVPNLFRVQIGRPEIFEAEAALLAAILFKTGSLSRIQKECILMMVAANNEDAACFALHCQMLRLLSVPQSRLTEILADYRSLSSTNAALMTFVLKLSSSAVSAGDLQALWSQNFSNQAVLETVLTTALGGFLCTISRLLRVSPDFATEQIPSVDVPLSQDVERGRPRREAAQLDLDSDQIRTLSDNYGFVPSVIQAQALLPDVIQAEVGLLRAISFPKRFMPSGSDAIEGAVINAFGVFLSTIQAAFGTKPDIELPELSRNKKVHLSEAESRQSDLDLSADPDSVWVMKVLKGDLDAFEELMRRHRQRVYRTLIGLLGNPEEAQDAMQDTFLKAFQHLKRFEGRSKFSTWLLSIASNTGIQRLRERKDIESLDEPDSELEQSFRPRQVQAWTEDPERLYSKTEMRALLEARIMGLPAKYRAVIMLRDIQQLSAEESAEALGLGMPALKARLLRGRLMLREALAPHFVSTASKGVTP